MKVKLSRQLTRLTIIVVGIAVAIMLVLLVGNGFKLDQLFSKKNSVDEFLQNHWAYPIPAQGKPPADFSALEASLDPASCGECHADQFAQWRNSLHSHTMGPGIRWQLQIADLKTAKSCLRCHAPMTEQLALFSQERGWSGNRSAPPEYIPDNLHRQGLVCAACHVRAHERHGPLASKPDVDRNVHGGFEEHQAYSDSRFCANCHQFEEDGPRVNGKLRENTYEEWLATDFAQQGTHCQSCHMPERQHIWRGIHDKEMTRSALSVELAAQPDVDGAYQLQALVTNSGAGHHFPTYMVPEIVLHLEVLDSEGKARELVRHIIGWRVNLALTEEIFDQRLASGESVRLNGELQNIANYRQLRLRISVAPRQHYVRTFEDYLQHNRSKLQPETLSLLQQSIQESRAAGYEFIAAELSLGRIAN
ncbi:MAG TPA: multiheme c-type cytochrome [Gammaproteobacteria bacterium]